MYDSYATNDATAGRHAHAIRTAAKQTSTTGGDVDLHRDSTHKILTMGCTKAAARRAAYIILANGGEYVNRRVD